MDIRTLLTETKAFPPRRKTSVSPILVPHDLNTKSSSSMNSSTPHATPQQSPTTPAVAPKKVKFTLNSDDVGGALSFVLSISPSDPPNAITSTVKDFFALHNCGISFTDKSGCILIVTPDNLTDDMEVIVNQTNVVTQTGTVNQSGIAEGIAEAKRKKRRKSLLSSRKKTRRMSIDSDLHEVENEEDEEDDERLETDHQEMDHHETDHHEKKERVLSSDVSIDNILEYSSRRRLTKFSSEVYPGQY
jgi:hypothetical protein